MKKNNLLLFFCFIIIIYFLISNLWWMIGNNSIESYFTQTYPFLSIKYFYKIKRIILNTSHWGIKTGKLFNLLRHPIPHSLFVRPPLVYFCSFFSYFIFGRHLIATRLSMIPFLVILLISMYYLGRDLYSINTGVIAAILVIMYPLVFESFRQFGVHGIYFPLTAMASLCFWMLIKSKNFKSLKYSILLGFCVGVGMLIGAQLILFLILPFAISIYNGIKLSSIKPREVKTRSIIRNILFFLVIAVGVSWIWWGRYYNEAIFYLKFNIFDPYMYRVETQAGMERYSFSSVIWYIKNMITSSVGPVFFIIFIFGLFQFFSRDIFKKGLFISWFFFPLFLFTFVFAGRSAFFLMPVYPAMAIITARGFTGLKSEKKKILIYITLLYSVVQFSCLTFGNKTYRGGVQGDNIFVGGTTFGDIKKEKKFKFNEVIQVFDRFKNKGRTLNILSLSLLKGRPYEIETLYWLSLKREEIKAVDFTQMFRYVCDNFYSFDFTIIKYPKKEDISSLYNRRELIGMLREGLYLVDYYSRIKKDKWKELFSKFYKNVKDFKLIRKISTEYGYDWLVFKNKI